MLSHSDLKKGVKIILDGEPYEVLQSSPMKKAQRRVVIQTKIKNLLTGNVLERNFHQSDTFQEAELEKLQAKFIYTHRGRYFFCQAQNPSQRFDLTEQKIGQIAKFLKPEQIVEAVVFEGEVINISLPIKIQLRVKEAPIGLRGDRSQSGTKIVTLENNSQIAVPLFIKEGDIIELNTETEEYVKRV